MLAKAAMTSVLRRPVALGKTLPATAAPAARLFSTDKAVEEVNATTKHWIKTVTGQKPTSPAETAALYAKDAVLWATVSEELRVTPQEIKDYFDVFATLPNLTVTGYKPFIRIYGDMAINDGYYTVHFDGPEGKKTTKARYVFVYRKNAQGKWEIIDHHSSAMPTPPAGLKRALTCAPP